MDGRRERRTCGLQLPFITLLGPIDITDWYSAPHVTLKGPYRPSRRGANVVTLRLRREQRTFPIASSASFARGVARAGLNHEQSTLSRINMVPSVANLADRARGSDPIGETCASALSFPIYFTSVSLFFLLSFNKRN